MTHAPALGVAAAIDLWITGRLARQELTQSTAAGYRYTADDFADHVGPETPINRISTLDLEAWLARPRRNGRPYKPQSINTRSNPIRAFFKWAEDNDLVDRDPARHLGRAKVGQRFAKGLAERDVRLLLLVSDLRDRTIILVGLHLGLRRAELAAMDLSHWDRRDQVLYVVGKGNKERSLPVAGEVKDSMELWASLGLNGGRAGPFWPSNIGPTGSLAPEQVGRIVKARAHQAGVQATTHSLRHTCATDMVRAGVPLPIVQAWLGHSSPATTGLYVVPGAGDLQRFAESRRYLPPSLAVPDVVA